MTAKPKTKRPCVICGARVRNPNQKVKTCDHICTAARKLKVTRNEAAFQIAMMDESD